MNLKTFTRIMAVPLFGLVLTGCSVSGAKASSGASSYPTKPINMVIPFNAGGPSDVQARALQPALQRALGQKLHFEYKVGAGGAVGFQFLAHAKPDGYTVGGVNLPHIILEPLAKQGNFKWQDFTFIAQSYHDPTVLAVKKGSPIHTLKDFINACKARPGKVTVGGVGEMTGHYLASYKIRDKLGVKFDYVPFQGSAPEDAALLGGHVQVMIGNLSDIMRSPSKYHMLAIASKKRSSLAPNVPTFKELGYNVENSIERGFAVPKGTPKPIVDKLRKAFKTALHSQSYLKKMKKLKAPIQYLDGPQFKSVVEQVAKTSVAELKKYHAIKTKAKSN